MAKKKVVTNDGTKGGNLVGKPHRNKQGQDVGGIKAVVTDANNRPVELEGGEVIINKEASKKHWKELSRINQSAGGGVPINKPQDPHDEDPEEYSKGGKIEFNPNKLPNKWILKYAENIKKNHPEIWKKGGNIYGNQAFLNLQRVAKRGYWLDSEEWFYIKWRSFVARHKGDFRIAGVVAMLKWVDKVDRGWQYMKNLIEDEIKKIEVKKSKKQKGGWSVSREERMSKGGNVSWKEKYNKKYGYEKDTSHDLEEISKDTGVSLKGLQEIYNKGVGARKTNPESVRSVSDGKKRGGKSLKGKMSAEQWAMGRVYSAVMGGKASKIDADELKMSDGGEVKESREKNSFVTYRLKNQKGKGYNGLYKKLFNLLNKDSIFSECYEEDSYYDGNDMIVTCSWGLEGELPKGITEVDKFNKGGQTEAQQEKIAYTMREFKEGNLKTSYGKKVTDEKQAIAIALSKAGIEDEEYKNGGRVAPTTSANDVPPYTVQKSDNNGELYISKPTAKGYQQWRKFKGQLLKLGQEVTVNQVKGIIEGIFLTEPEKYQVRLSTGTTKIVDTSKETIQVVKSKEKPKTIEKKKTRDYKVGDRGIYNGKKPVPIEITKITGANVYFINEKTGEQKRSQVANFERLYEPIESKQPEMSEEEFIEHANKEIETWKTEQPTGEFVPTPIEEIEVGDVIEFNTASNSGRYRATVEEEESYGKFVRVMDEPYNGARFRLKLLMDIQKIEYLSERKYGEEAKKKPKKKPESEEKPDYYKLFKDKYNVQEYSNNEVVGVVLNSFVKMVDEDRLMSKENINELGLRIDTLS